MRTFLIVLLLGVVLILLGLLLVRNAGPGVAPPLVDPLVRLNAEHADIAPADNAAELYDRAAAGLPQRPAEPEDSVAYIDTVLSRRISAAAHAWLAEHYDAVQLIREASQRPACWWPMQRDTSGMASFPELSRVRNLAKLMQVRAQVAAEAHDLDTLTDSLLVLDRMARHVADVPALMHALVATAIEALAQPLVLAPYEWPELTVADRQDYARCMAPLLDPIPPLVDAIATEEEDGTWIYAQNAGGGVPRSWRILASPARVRAELHVYAAAVTDLLNSPIEEQLDPGSSAYQAAAALAARPVSKLNVPRMLAGILFPSLTRPAEIRGRLIASQRGNAAALEVIQFRDSHGFLPEALDLVPDEFRIDPYAAQPFRYVVTDDEFVLYSVGADRDDDGGAHHPRFGEQRDATIDGDYVIWPRPSRLLEPVAESP